LTAQIVPGRLYPRYLLTKLYKETGNHSKSCETAKTVPAQAPKIKSLAEDNEKKIDKPDKIICVFSKKDVVFNNFIPV
jgi:hypothetical protein